MVCPLMPPPPPFFLFFSLCVLPLEKKRCPLLAIPTAIMYAVEESQGTTGSFVPRITGCAILLLAFVIASRRVLPMAMARLVLKDKKVGRRLSFVRIFVVAHAVWCAAAYSVTTMFFFFCYFFLQGEENLILVPVIPYGVYVVCLHVATPSFFVASTKSVDLEDKKHARCSCFLSWPSLSMIPCSRGGGSLCLPELRCAGSLFLLGESIGCSALSCFFRHFAGVDFVLLLSGVSVAMSPWPASRGSERIGCASGRCSFFR